MTKLAASMSAPLTRSAASRRGTSPARSLRDLRATERRVFAQVKEIATRRTRMVAAMTQRVAKAFALSIQVVARDRGMSFA